MPVSFIDISGQATLSGAGLNGVTITFNNSGGTTTTAASGSINGATNLNWNSGARTITRTGGSWVTDGFIANVGITVAGSNTSANNGTYFVSAVSALVLTLAAGHAITTNTTDTGAAANGNVAGDAGWYTKHLISATYSITPSLTGYTFAPVNYTGVSTTQTAENFAATATGGSNNVTGTVKKNGAGVLGVSVAYSGGSTTTAADGTYTLPAVADGTYTLTFRLGGHVLNPTTLSVTVAGASVSGKDSAANQATPVALV